MKTHHMYLNNKNLHLRVISKYLKSVLKAFSYEVWLRALKASKILK